MMLWIRNREGGGIVKIGGGLVIRLDGVANVLLRLILNR